MKPTMEQLRAAKDKLSKQIGSKTGISYVGIRRGELKVGYRPDYCETPIPHQIDGVLVRAVKVCEIVAFEPSKQARW